MGLEVGQFIESVSRGRQVLPFPFDLALLILVKFYGILDLLFLFVHLLFVDHVIWPISSGTIDLAP